MEVYVTSIYDNDSDTSDLKVFETKEQAQAYAYSEYEKIYLQHQNDGDLDCDSFVPKSEFWPGDLGEQDVYAVIQCYDMHITFTIATREVERTLEIGRCS